MASPAGTPFHTAGNIHYAFVSNLDQRATPQQQAEFAERSNRIVGETVTQITDGMEQGKNLQELFHQLLNRFGQERRKIASDHQTLDADEYGIRRDAAPIDSITPFKFLAREEVQGKRLLRFFAEQMDQMPHNLREFQEKTRRVDRPCLDRQAAFHLEVLDPQTTMACRWNRQPTREEFNAVRSRALQSLTLPDQLDRDTEEGKNEVIKLTLMEIKKTDPDYYKRDKMSDYFKILIQLFPSPERQDFSLGAHEYVGNTDNLKSLYALGTARLEIGGKSVALSQYLTWLYCDHQQDPVNRMRERSTVMVLLQDVFLIEQTLQDCATVFEKAVQWDKKDRVELKNRIGTFCYEMGHVRPFKRGNSSVVHWFENALYRFHGFDIDQKQTSLDALSFPLFPGFMRFYQAKVQL